jgi:hypothetical protein
MFCPSGLFVALGSRSDHRRIDQRAFAHASALCSRSRAIASNRL